MKDFKCKHGHVNDYYAPHDGRRRCRKCRTDRVAKNRRKSKEKLIQLHGGKCVVCGYNRCMGALHFHHLDPSEKLFGISENGFTRKFEYLVAESKKCILVCSNCHCELENGMIQYEGTTTFVRYTNGK